MKTINSTAFRIFGNNPVMRNRWVQRTLVLKSFDLAITVTRFAYPSRESIAQDNGIHVSISNAFTYNKGKEFVDLGFTIPTPSRFMARYGHRFLRYLRTLDPRPCYVMFSGRDCDHSHATYAHFYWTRFQAFRAMENTCHAWTEGPCGWHFITKAEYQKFNDEEF